MQHQAGKNARDNAKTLRSGMTDAERRLWSRLRGEQLGFKFRRQHPVGPYVLDFACLEPKLAIEVDGSQHLDQVDYDHRRDGWIANQGFQVLRFWANEVLSETDAVVSRVLDVLAAAQPLPPLGEGRDGGAMVPVAPPRPHPNPPPVGEGV